MNDMGRFADLGSSAPSGRALLWRRYRAALDAHPVAVAFVTVVLPLLAVACGLGIAAWFGFSGSGKYPFLIVGGGLIGFQYAAYAQLRHVRGQEWLAHFVLVVGLTASNAVSVAAGLAAMNPDGLGRAMIERELAPIMVATDQAATDLTTVSAQVDAVAEYSNRQREYETSKDNYRKTCPTSTDWGVGPVSEWRRSSAEAATALAVRVRTAAANARSAANAAQARGQAYRLAAHDQDMAEIVTQVGAARAAVAAADLSGVRASLLELGRSVATTGACPDAGLAGLIDTAIKGLDVDIAIPPFAPLPRPTEETAVDDILAQTRNIFRGKADFGPYWPYMILSIIADGLAMAMLKSALGPKRRPTIQEKFARKIGPEVDAARLPHAMREVEASPAWQEIRAAVTRGTRLRRPVHKVVVSSEKQGLGLFLRWLRRKGHARSETTIGDETHFVLHPKTLDRWFEDLVREWFRLNPAPRDPVSPSSGLWQ